jgi:hypothetical protein
MVEDIFSGLLEGLVELVFEVVGEFLSEVLNGIANWPPGGVNTGGEFGTGGPVERYKFLPRDLHD